MADYAPNYTARLRVKYTSGGANHSITFRAPHGLVTPQATLVSRAQDFLDEAAPFMFADWSVVGSEYAARDSDLFLPIAGVATPGNKSAVASTRGTVPSFISFVGRSTGGSRARLSLFGVTLQGDSSGGGDYRFSAGESADLQLAINALNASGDLGGIDGGIALWYNYVNLGYNSHWQRAQRG